MAYKQDDLRDAIRGFADGGESPIEEMFLGALRLSLGFRATVEEERWVYDIQVLPQHQVDAYRVDVALIAGDQRLAIECDGHDFHEKTKQQAARDKARDRALVAAGYTVLRFTGSEIWRNPFSCAYEAICQLNGMVGDALWVAEKARRIALQESGKGAC